MNYREIDDAGAAPDHGHHAEAAHGADHAGHHAPAAFGPEVRLEHTFPEPGHYRMWVQVGHHGQVMTAPFTVEVR